MKQRTNKRDKKRRKEEHPPPKKNEENKRHADQGEERKEGRYAWNSSMGRKIKHVNGPLINLSLPVEQHEFVLVRDAEVPAGGDVPDAHGVEPVDVAASPLGPGQLETPEGSSLRGDRAALVHHNARGRREKGISIWNTLINIRHVC